MLSSNPSFAYVAPLAAASGTLLTRGLGGVELLEDLGLSPDMLSGDGRAAVREALLARNAPALNTTLMRVRGEVLGRLVAEGRIPSETREGRYAALLRGQSGETRVLSHGEVLRTAVRIPPVFVEGLLEGLGLKASAKLASKGMIETPLKKDREGSETLGRPIFIKDEARQRGGSIRMRGFVNYLIFALFSGWKPAASGAAMAQPDDVRLIPALKAAMEAVGLPPRLLRKNASREALAAPWAEHPLVSLGEGTVGIEIGLQMAALGHREFVVVTSLGDAGLVAGLVACFPGKVVGGEDLKSVPAGVPAVVLVHDDSPQAYLTTLLSSTVKARRSGLQEGIEQRKVKASALYAALSREGYMEGLQVRPIRSFEEGHRFVGVLESCLPQDWDLFDGLEALDFGPRGVEHDWSLSEMFRDLSRWREHKDEVPKRVALEGAAHHAGSGLLRLSSMVQNSGDIAREERELRLDLEWHLARLEFLVGFSRKIMGEHPRWWQLRRDTNPFPGRGGAVRKTFAQFLEDYEGALAKLRRLKNS